MEFSGVASPKNNDTVSSDDDNFEEGGNTQEMRDDVDIIDSDRF